MIYLASPYTAKDSQFPSSEENIRYLQNLHVTSILTSRGHSVLSPVVLGHAIAVVMQTSNLPIPSYDFWLAWSRELLESCEKMFVLCLPGWDESRGVREEIRFAHENDITIFYINTEGFIVNPEEE